MSDTPSRTERIERYLSLIVGISAIIAAMVSLYQAALAREQARAAAWPYLNGGVSLTEGRPFTYQLSNRGVGPARIRTVSVTVDGTPVPTWTEAITRVTGAAPEGYDYSYIGPGSVLSPGGVDTLVTIPSGKQAFTFWKEGRQRLSVTFCYCSVYDDCWVTQQQSLEALPVKACPSPGKPEFIQ